MPFLARKMTNHTLALVLFKTLNQLPETVAKQITKFQYTFQQGSSDCTEEVRTVL